MAKETKSHHVVPTLGGGWGVLREGAIRASKRFSTQAAAISWGRQQSIKNRSQLVIHRRDGMVAGKNSYGNDSNRPHDQKK